MDYTKFLGQRTTEVLPYLGGAFVDAQKRRLHITREVEPGWWSFSISGRRADPIERGDAPDLSSLPRVRGHVVGNWLFADGDRPERLRLLPTEELELLTVVSARRWSRELLVFEGVDFESDAETEAREALDHRGAISELRGVAASLRAAYGWALLSRIGQERSIPVALSEARGSFREIAERGAEAANRILTSLQERRRRADEARIVHRAVRTARQEARSTQQRVAEALDKAGATLRRMRNLGDGTIEVRFWYMDETFISTVEAATLQVIDSGICLDGEDRVTNLQSLPSVIREAIETGQLCITRT